MIAGAWLSYAVLLLPTAVVAPFAVRTLYVHLRLKIRGVEISAKCEYAYHLNGKDVLGYRYVDEADRGHFQTARVSYSLPFTEEGAAVAVVYDPAKPDRSRTRFELARPLPWAGVNIATWLIVQLVCAYLAASRPVG